MTSWTYERTVREEDLPALSRLIYHAFATEPDLTALWLRNAGLGESRAMRNKAGEPEACLLRIPMGHFYGGRSVPALGIAAVAVAPERRGKGLGRELMRASVLEAAEEGWAISSLYASTQSLYRQVGFEQAGSRFCVRIQARDFAIAAADDAWKAVEVRTLSEADTDAVKALYRDFAMRYDGLLDRGAYCWGRVWNLRNEPCRGFGFFGGHGEMEGYVYLNQKRNPATGRHDVHTTDVVFTTARAGRAIVKFLGGFATTADTVYLYGGPAHPLLALLDQQRYAIDGKDFWMIRVTDLRRALEARGWPAQTSAECVLDVTDELSPANSGRWTVRIAEGRADVERGASRGDGVRVQARGAAAIFAGMFSATHAAMAGLAEGDERALRAADAVFRGGSPWMIEMF